VAKPKCKWSIHLAFSLPNNLPKTTTCPDIVLSSAVLRIKAELDRSDRDKVLPNLGILCLFGCINIVLANMVSGPNRGLVRPAIRRYSAAGSFGTHEAARRQ
jgi:hypothetical protein